MGDVQILAPGTSTAPLDYKVPGSQEIFIKTATANYDGTGAGGSFVPCLQIIGAGGVVALTCPIGQSVAAGASADASWFPGLGVSSTTTTGHTVQVPVYLDSPDGSSNAFIAFFSDFGITQANIGRHVAPGFLHALTCTWEGILRVPQDYQSGGALVLSWFVNANTGAVRHRVSTATVINGATYNTTYTDEAYVNTTVPGTALFRFDTTFTLSTTPAAGRDLYIKVTRDGGNAADTCTAASILAKCMFSYASSRI